MLKYIIFFLKKSMYKLSKENVYSKMFFFSHKYLQENVFIKYFQ